MPYPPSDLHDHALTDAALESLATEGQEKKKTEKRGSVQRKCLSPLRRPRISALKSSPTRHVGRQKPQEPNPPTHHWAHGLQTAAGLELSGAGRTDDMRGYEPGGAMAEARCSAVPEGTTLVYSTTTTSSCCCSSVGLLAFLKLQRFLIISWAVDSVWLSFFWAGPARRWLSQQLRPVLWRARQHKRGKHPQRRGKWQQEIR